MLKNIRFIFLLGVFLTGTISLGQDADSVKNDPNIKGPTVKKLNKDQQVQYGIVDLNEKLREAQEELAQKSTELEDIMEDFKKKSADYDDLNDRFKREAYKITDSTFIDSVFIDTQFGGGMMLSIGGGLSFFKNIVRTEVLFGYTPDGVYKDISITGKLNARMLQIKINDEMGFFGTIGACFTFFSGNAKVAPAFLISQELDFRNIWIFTVLTVFLEQDFYFVDNKEGSLLMQFAMGVRVNIF
jgi:hypothetical protein